MKSIVKVIIFILIIGLIILIPLLVYSSYLTYRYTKYNELIGHYELVSGSGLNELDINLTNWSMGKKEDLRCDLWNCVGYEEGKSYNTYDNKIQFHYNSKGYVEYKYEITNENGKTYLILQTSNAYETTSNKYEKIK